MVSRGMTDLSETGVKALATGIASSRSLQYLELCHYGREWDTELQLRVDIICRTIRESQAIKRIALDGCCLPWPDIFRELCKIPTIDYVVLCHIRRRGSNDDALLENELHNLLGLKRIDFAYCDSNTVRAGLCGLVEHPALNMICFFSQHRSSVELFCALDQLLESQEQKASRKLSFQLVFCHHNEINTFLDVIIQRDALKELDLKVGVNKTAAAKLQVFLKASNSLRVLRLASNRLNPQYLNEPLLEILEGVQKSKYLCKLSVFVTAPETVFLMLKGNMTLRVLTLCGTDQRNVEDKIDFEGLKHLHGLCRLDVSSLIRGSSVCSIYHCSVHCCSLIAALKVNASLQEINWGRAFQALANDEKINSHLKSNRWFNQHKQEILMSLESLHWKLWPRFFGKVSLNINALHSVVLLYPGIFEKHYNETQNGESSD